VRARGRCSAFPPEANKASVGLMIFDRNNDRLEQFLPEEERRAERFRQAQELELYPVADGAVLTWRREALIWDGIKTGFGLVCTLLLLAAAPEYGFFWGLFLVVSLIFAAFACQLIARMGTRLSVTGDGVARSVRLFGRTWRHSTVPWRELARLKLRYYSTHRSFEKGWMTLELKARGGSAIGVDGGLEDFAGLLTRAVEEVRALGGTKSVLLDKTTARNLDALGFEPIDLSAEDLTQTRTKSERGIEKIPARRETEAPSTPEGGAER